MSCELCVVGFGLWVVGCESWVMSCELWVMSCELWVLSCELRLNRFQIARFGLVRTRIEVGTKPSISNWLSDLGTLW